LTAEHVCVLDSFRYGARGCRCGRWFMPLRGEWLTAMFVSSELRDRAREYGYAIRDGQFPDLRAAVKAHAAQVLRERAAANAKIRERWEARQRNTYARFIRAAREKLLIPGARCAYCSALAQTLDHVLPASRWPDLMQRFSNLAPACKSCNAQKHNRTVDEWEAHRIGLGLPWPPLTVERPLSAATPPAT
jgi:5-methylcytosine-specific restriction endonuclease McrA